MVRHSIRTVCTLFFFGFSVSGCGVGLNSVLFVTKTQVAVDADTEPPSLDIGYAREEFVLAPVFKDGKVLPVLTTVATETGAFSLGSSHSFATGDAALVLADALTDPNDYQFSPSIPATPPSHPARVLRPSMNSTIQTNADDRVPHGFWNSLWSFFCCSSERQRYFFGTDTNLGLHVEWGGSEVPRSVAIGFKRKELAYVPLIESEKPATSTVPATREVTLASLIATANVQVNVTTQEKSGLGVAQTFATGSAATLLASHPGVREVLGPLLIQEYKKIQEAEDKFKALVSDRKSKEPVFNWIEKAYKTETDPTKKQEFVKEALDLKLVPAGTTTELFLQELAANNTSKAPPDSLQRLQDFKNVMLTKHGYKN